MEITECLHASTCLPDYWGGHHLPHLSIFVEPNMTIQGVKDCLRSEVNEGSWCGAVDYEETETDTFNEQVLNAIDSIELGKDTVDGELFSELEESEESEDFVVQAYFVFR